jgi:hypothetical protein
MNENSTRVAQVLEPVERSSKRLCRAGCHEQPTIPSTRPSSAYRPVSALHPQISQMDADKKCTGSKLPG